MMVQETWEGRVEWIDTDAAGIHHNTAITRFVESAEAQLMRRLGLPDYFRHAPRVRYEVDFESALRFGQPVAATISILQVGTTSMAFTFEVWGGVHQGQPQQRAARGRYVTVHVDSPNSDTHSARSSPWPSDWMEALGADGSRSTDE